MLAVLNAKYDIKGNSKEGKNLPNEIRKKLNIKKDAPVDMRYIPEIVKIYNEKFGKNYTYLVADREGEYIDSLTTFDDFNPAKKKEKSKEQIEKEMLD